MRIEHNGWTIVIPDGEPEYAHISRPGLPGAVHVKAESEDYVADIWPENYERVEATAAALYSDLEPDLKEG